MRLKKLFTLTLFMIMAVGIKDGYAAYPLTAKDVTDGNVFEETDFDGLATQAVNEVADVDNINDCSNDNTEFQTTKDPYASDTEVRPVNATEEFQILREISAQNSSIPSAGWYKYQELTVITTNATLSLYVNNYIASCTNACTLTLDSAVGDLDKRYWIKNKATTTVTIDGDGSETIDGSTTYTLGGANKWVSIISDGVNWHIKSRSYQGQFDYYANFYARASNDDSYVTSISADYLTVKNAGGDIILLSSVVESSNISSSLLHGLDVGASANASEYFVYIVHNPSIADTDTLISSSDTSPVLPDGYTYFRLVTYNRTIDSSGSDYLLGFVQQNGKYLYDSTNIVGGGVYTTRFFSDATLDIVDVVPEDFIPTCPSLTTQIYINFTSTCPGGGACGLVFAPENATLQKSAISIGHEADAADAGHFWVRVKDADGAFRVLEDGANDPSVKLAVAGFMFKL